jgi:hypothetical protein
VRERCTMFWLMFATVVVVVATALITTRNT